MLGIDSWSPKRSTNTGSGGKKEKKGDLGGKTDERQMRRTEEECREKNKRR
jgi:hypothetical protein